MKKQQDSSIRAAALQITLSVALLFASAIWLASAAPINPKEASGPGRFGVHSQSGIAAPTLGNYPDTSLPLSTDTTVTPDAAPTDTTSINVSTSTDFNGTLTGDPTTGVVQVTNAHPAGTYTVTVTAFDGGGATASKTFTLTVTTPETCNPVYFPTATIFPAGGLPNFVAVGDFNGDGNQDLAVANTPLPGTVGILLGDGTGNFSAPTNFPVDSFPHSPAVGDFNGDGKQDLAVANFISDNVSILLGDGTGNFSAATNFGAGDSPSSVAVGDFNGDGKQDLAVANFGSDNVSILLGDGTGSFSAATNFAAGDGQQSVAVGDFNRDGNQDLAVANEYSDNVSIFLGDGTGNFSAATNFGVDDNPWTVAVGDFNGDGKQDLAVTNLESDNVSILLGDGTGSFSAATNFAAGDGPYSVAVGDFNGDGNQDLATANAYSESVSILLGDGTGNFSDPTNFTAGNNVSSVAVGDFNGDGLQDLATSGTSGNVSILLRNCPGQGTLLSAASRLKHGSAGAFDINMPLNGTPGVEDRRSATYNAVFTFAAPVTSGEVTVLSGTATVGAITFSGNEMRAALTGVTDVQTVVLHTQNINGDGQPHGDVPFSFLIGDVDGNRMVAKPDANQAKTDKNEVVNASNFRDDTNRSGVVDKPDYNLVKANQGHRLR